MKQETIALARSRRDSRNGRHVGEHEDPDEQDLHAGAQVRSFLYGYGHLLIYGAIVAAGVGIELAAEEAAHHGHGHPDLLLGGSQIVLVIGFLTISQGIGLRVPRPFSPANF
ncbi:low temperature requirement A protein (LtrA) [Micromonospora citrea]|uniref:Low temperature requirement A protein (LtrA) n=2 Tax=Micromonospora citrea TaxID=47855 RepID=A0A1C6TQD6_9ACTN|nr:low temperature requirement A protein (LtrA) [Micromonospora citrea]